MGGAAVSMGGIFKDLPSSLYARLMGPSFAFKAWFSCDVIAWGTPIKNNITPNKDKHRMPFAKFLFFISIILSFSLCLSTK
jgi:hypothetical protein